VALVSEPASTSNGQDKAHLLKLAVVNDIRKDKSGLVTASTPQPVGPLVNPKMISLTWHGNSRRVDTANASMH